MTLIVACGLKREARIIARPGRDAIAVAGGGDPARLARELDEAVGRFPGIILSSGLAGALDPSLRAGDMVLDGTRALVERLRMVLPGACVGRIVGSDAILATAAAKRSLADIGGAIAVDMESHVASSIAARRGLPFAALRTISDRADMNLPPAALVGMRADGGMALGAVLRSLARHPAQLPALVRTGIGAERAFAALARCHDMLGRGGIDRLDPGEFALDMG